MKSVELNISDITYKLINKIKYSAFIRPQNILKIFVGSVGLFVAYKTVKIYLLRKRYQHIPGPKTSGILGYYLGNAYDFSKVLSKGEIIPDYLLEIHKLYGDTFKFQFFDEMIVITNDKDAIKEILITKNCPKSPGFFKMIAYPIGERFLGYGLLTDPNYLRWKHRRSMFNPGFHRNVLMTFVHQFNIKADMLMERFRSMADGKTSFSLFTEFNHATLDAIAQIAFGMSTDSINEKDTSLNIAIAGMLKLVENGTKDKLLKYKINRRNEFKEFRHFISYVRNVGKEKILERLKALKNKDHIPTDILSSILESWKDEEMDLETMVDDFVTFFIAGQETTATSLSFCFMEIAKNPSIVLKAREEIDSVLGERTEISYQDAIDLKYCSSIFKEALRLYPPVPIIDRYTPEEMTVGDYKIPAKTIFNLPIYIGGRSEKYFDNPLEFRPERFLKTKDYNSGANVENYRYFPFSLGPRNCIGQNFAQIEGVILIAKIIQKFDITLDPNQSFKMCQSLTLRPADGARCILKLRST